MGVFLANAPEHEDDAKTPLRVAQIVPMPPQMWEQFEQRFNLTLLRTGLGQSECQLVMTQLENREDVPVYALGFPIADTEISLRDDDGVAVAVGEAGEICIKALAPHIVFNGYFNNPEATEQAYRDGWYLTGDMARQDAETGTYFFVDRKKMRCVLPAETSPPWRWRVCCAAIPMLPTSRCLVLPQKKWRVSTKSKSMSYCAMALRSLTNHCVSSSTITPPINSCRGIWSLWKVCLTHLPIKFRDLNCGKLG